jgi:hypothetical protein
VIDDIDLTFMRGVTDISDKFLVETITPLPTAGFIGTTTIDLNITVAQSVTAGGVVVDAVVTGYPEGNPTVPLDDDGAVTPLTWLVKTSELPIIVSIVADEDIYWTSQTITLTVTGEIPGYSVSGDFTPIGGGVVAGTDNADKTYTIQYTTGGSLTDGYYVIDVDATNVSGTTSDSITIRLGDAPTFSGWSQNPTDGNVEPAISVDVSIQIDDNTGSSVLDVDMIYRINGGTWNSYAMNYGGGTTWTYTIPGQAAGAYVEYVINATDPSDLHNSYEADYSVNAPSEPVFVPGTDLIHAPGDPGTEYNETNPAPRNGPVSHSADIDTSFVAVPQTFVILVSTSDPMRHGYVDYIVMWLDIATNPSITLNLTYPSTDVPAGTLITGELYILNDFLNASGKVINQVAFTYIVN